MYCAVDEKRFYLPTLSFNEHILLMLHTAEDYIALHFSWKAYWQTRGLQTLLDHCLNIIHINSLVPNF